MRNFGTICKITIPAVIFLCGTICFAQDRPESFSGRGYVGTLPDLTRDYEATPSKKDEVEKISSKYFNSENELKPVPREDPAFVNIIMKQDKTSQYVNDLNEFIPILESVCDLIENKGTVQAFNAKVYYFNKNADCFRDKYINRPESEFVSYKKLMELNLHSKSVALLRAESAKYNPYLAYGSAGYIYNPNNISEQLEFLKAEIEKTIIILKESD